MNGEHLAKGSSSSTISSWRDMTANPFTVINL